MAATNKQHDEPDAQEAAAAELVICPYCGAVQHDAMLCDACAGRFEPLSRQASQNQMGPWYVRDAEQPFRPGCNYPTLKRFVERGMVGATTIIRGPTTHQFWAPATRTPGVAHLLGICHNCAGEVDPDAYSCEACGAIFTVPQDRQHLGLGSIRLLPGNAPPDVVAESARPQLNTPESPSTQPTAEEATHPSDTPELPEIQTAPKQKLTPEERETLARQATRDDDAPTITRSANRRLRHSLTRMRWLIALLIVFNLFLILTLIIMLNPRLNIDVGDANTQNNGPVSQPSSDGPQN